MENIRTTPNFIKSSPVRNWYVIYTRAKWEKKVDLLLKQQGIHSFCPVRTVRNQWADRIKTVELPLFSGYVFVNISLKEELIVRQTYGVINFVYYLGKPAIIRDADMSKLKDLLIKNPGAEVVSTKQFSVGDRVVIKQGFLSNHQGNVIKVSGKTVLMVFDNLESAVVTRVPAANLSVIGSEYE